MLNYLKKFGKKPEKLNKNIFPTRPKISYIEKSMVFQFPLSIGLKKS